MNGKQQEKESLQNGSIGKRVKNIMKRYRYFLAFIILYLILAFVSPELGRRSMEITWGSMVDMLSVIPPIFILLGLLDVWVKRETMVKYMGEGSGFLGVILAFFIGSAAAGPLYGAFPVAGVLLRKGSKLSNVLIMLGAWSTTKIPQLLFEASALGVPFTALRLALDIAGIAVIAYFTEKLLTKEEKTTIYEKSHLMS